MVELIDKVFLDYRDYSRMLNRLVTILKKDKRMKRIKSVYGIPRGGLPIAVHLSHFLELKYSKDIMDDIVENTLIVDDIAHTGRTLSHGSNLFLTATLYWRPESIVKPDFYLEEATKWIVFPWEDHDEIPNRPLWGELC